MKKLTDHLGEVASKTVLVRCNFDVPVDNGQVQDTTRIEDAMPTIQQLIQNQAKTILIAHLGRPTGSYHPEFSLKPVAALLSQLLGQPVPLIEYQTDYHHLHIDPSQPIQLLENLRFWGQEEANDQDFSQTLASSADLYVNQAFANCHRPHASIIGLPRLLPAFAGINLAREVEILSKIRNHPDKPLVVVIGGSKLETKEPIINVFLDKADFILVGGKIAADIHAKGGFPPQVIAAEITPNGRDITTSSAQQFAHLINSAKTVIWNGTMGVFEEPENRQGTKIVAEAVNSCEAFTVVGGGDTETALTELDMEHNIDFISSGGGAMLDFLAEGKLVGLEALES